MAKVVSPIVAKVEVVGRPKEGNYGEYRPVLFLDQSQPEGSEEAKIWKSLTLEEAEPLRKGMTVQLVPAGVAKSGAPKHNIVIMSSAQSSTPQPQAATQAPAQPSVNPEDAFDQLLQQSARRYGRAIRLARSLAHHELGMSEDDLASLEGMAIAKEIASSIFIETNRRSR